MAILIRSKTNMGLNVFCKLVPEHSSDLNITKIEFWLMSVCDSSKLSRHYSDSESSWILKFELKTGIKAEADS